MAIRGGRGGGVANRHLCFKIGNIFSGPLAMYKDGEYISYVSRYVVGFARGLR